MNYRKDSAVSLNVIFYLAGVASALLLFTFIAAADMNATKQQLEGCKAEATAWYNAQTALSDELARWSMRGDRNAEIDASISLNFATQGHALKCIEPVFPPG